MDDIIATTMKNVPDDAVRETLYLGYIEALENNDWDTQMDCLNQDVAFDRALKKLHPDWNWVENEHLS